MELTPSISEIWLALNLSHYLPKGKEILSRFQSRAALVSSRWFLFAGSLPLVSFSVDRQVYSRAGRENFPNVPFQLTFTYLLNVALPKNFGQSVFSLNSYKYARVPFWH